VGAVGTPAGSYWAIARHLLSRESERDLSAIVPILMSAARRYAEAVGRAMVNEYTFGHAAAPVDVGDVDLAGIVTLTMRRFGRSRTADLLGGQLAQMDRLARIPIELGMEMEGPRPERGSGP
jgi:hypothetical protein